MNIKFMKHQIKNEIARSGQEYQFKRKKENKHHQIVGEEDIAIVKGIYHETNGYISLLKADASMVQSKKVPTILTLKENAIGIEQGDYTEIAGNKYKVTGVLDVQNYGIVVDISLEMEV